jgi:hypothetical protein
MRVYFKYQGNFEQMVRLSLLVLTMTLEVIKTAGLYPLDMTLQKIKFITPPSKHQNIFFKINTDKTILLCG